MISTARKIQCPRVPTKELWEIINTINIKPMSPQEFISYWDINYLQIALICGCSRRTVQRWFSNKYTPENHYLIRLALVHYIWTMKCQ